MLRAAIAALILLTALCGCAHDRAEQGEAFGASDAVYASIDTSEHVRLKMFLIGTKPEDAGAVHAALSEELAARINASLTIDYLPWSDYQVRYSLVLAGSEQIDMIYTSDWCFYQTEAARGAFLELSPEFLTTYMPLTMQSQSPVSFEQAKVGGKVYMITSNGPGVEGESWFAIRGDLRERLGIEPIETAEQLETYFQRVAAEVPGVLPYQAASEVPLFHILYEQPLGLNVVSAGYPWITRYVNDDHVPDVDDIHFRYFTPEYLDFALRMKRYSDEGFWERSAISTVTQVRSAFENGKSASMIWNQTIFLAGEQLHRNNPDWFAEYIDLNPGTIRRQTPYTNDGIAIVAFTRHPERAAMCLDLLKNDPALNDLIKGGIEGAHWIDAGEALYTPGPEAESYPWNHSMWAFNRSRDEMRMSTARTAFELEFEERQYAMVVHPAYENFRFDRTPVKAEWAVIEALEDEYRRLLELGITQDPAATIEEIRSKLQDAGFDRVDREFKAQYEAWTQGR